MQVRLREVFDPTLKTVIYGQFLARILFAFRRLKQGTTASNKVEEVPDNDRSVHRLLCAQDTSVVESVTFWMIRKHQRKYVLDCIYHKGILVSIGPNYIRLAVKES